MVNNIFFSFLKTKHEVSWLPSSSSSTSSSPLPVGSLTALLRLFSFPDSSSEWLTAPEESASSWEFALWIKQHGIRHPYKNTYRQTTKVNTFLLLLWGPGCSCSGGLCYHVLLRSSHAGLRCVSLRVSSHEGVTGRSEQCQQLISWILVW